MNAPALVHTFLNALFNSIAAAIWSITSSVCCLRSITPRPQMLRLASFLSCIKYAVTDCQQFLSMLPSRAAHSATNTHYEILGIPSSASAGHIKRAFRQKAKDLHPDLNSRWSASDGEAFLRLVTAYEVLSDPQQRQLYDISNNPGLPDVLRRTTASAQQYGAERQTDDRPDVFSWRYGLSGWAAQGPSSTDISTLNAQLRWSVSTALSKHRRALEQDLHTALVKAFLGPQLDVHPGQLPSAFEGDERAHPSLTADLLHLVHGRALLGVVRIKQQLLLEGSPTGLAALPNAQHIVTAALPAPTAALPQHNYHSKLIAGTTRQRQQSTVEAEKMTPKVPPEHQAEAGDSSHQSAYKATESKAAAGSGDDITEVEWQLLLQQRHPLHGLYDWSAHTAEAAERPAAEQQDATMQTLGQLAGTCCDRYGLVASNNGNIDADCAEGTSERQLQCDAFASNDWGYLGGTAARAQWENSQALQACWQDEATVTVKCAPADYHGSKGGRCTSSHHQEDSHISCGACVTPDSTEEQRQRHTGELHLLREQQQQTGRTHEQSHQPPPHQHKRSRKQGRSWRWLQTPSADWTSADWSFDDNSDGVLLLEMTDDRRQLIALAVRDTTQQNKPCKVYVDGRFIAAVLDDIVMEPLTGRLMSVLYRFSTPGVQHLYFYLPSKGASRVLARLQRRWMPPSATWLFPPRSELHGVGGWSIEWEGFEHVDKPGWIHPAVYVLTAACYSRDMELRKAKQGLSAVQLLWQKAAAPDSVLGRAMQWLQDKWSRRTTGSAAAGQQLQ